MFLFSNEFFALSCFHHIIWFVYLWFKFGVFFASLWTRISRTSKKCTSVFLHFDVKCYTFKKKKNNNNNNNNHVNYSHFSTDLGCTITINKGWKQVIFLLCSLVNLLSRRNIMPKLIKIHFYEYTTCFLRYLFDATSLLLFRYFMSKCLFWKCEKFSIKI